MIEVGQRAVWWNTYSERSAWELFPQQFPAQLTNLGRTGDRDQTVAAVSEIDDTSVIDRETERTGARQTGRSIG